MTTIYFVRHVAYVSQGAMLPFRTPGVHLSPLGEKQAEKLAAFFIGKPIAAFYTSPLERCQETAKRIAGDTSVTVDERLNEVNCMPMPDEISGWDKYGAAWYTKRGGESMEEITNRMKSFVAEKIREHEGQEIVAVSHGDPILLLQASVLHTPVTKIPYLTMGNFVRLTFEQDSID